MICILWLLCLLCSFEQLFLSLYQILRGLLLLDLHVQEDDDARDVVHDALLFALPSQVGLAHHGLRSLFGVLRLVEGPDDRGHLVVAEELPDAVRRQDDVLVVLAQVKFQYLYTQRE